MVFPHRVVHYACQNMLGLVRPPKLDRPKAAFSGLDQGDRLVVSPYFVSVIGALLAIASYGRSSL
jgi:hypothetical protein